jgi:hypothetical protein
VAKEFVSSAPFSDSERIKMPEENRGTACEADGSANWGFLPYQYRLSVVKKIEESMFGSVSQIDGKVAKSLTCGRRLKLDDLTSAA